MHQERFDMQAVAPEGYRAMAGVQRFVSGSSLPHDLLELIKLRASQINRCAYCLDMHMKDATALAMSAEKLYMLPAWREALCYDERERAALEWTEELTLLAQRDVSDEVYARVGAQFAERELAELTMAVVAINGWNRIAVSTRMAPGHYQSRLKPAVAAGAR